MIEIEHGWSDKSYGPMNMVGHEEFDAKRRENRAKFLLDFGLTPSRSVQPKVMHGNKVEVVDVSNHGMQIPLECDALITDKPGLALTMPFADCFPVILVDQVKNVVAIMHCGWRPLDKEIVNATIEKMRDQFNCDPKDIIAHVGPGICTACYEVKEDVYEKFVPLASASIGRLRLNLLQVIRTQLIFAGVERINTAGANCTACSDNDDGTKTYYSWRRDKSDPLDCQMALVVMRQ